MKPCKKKDPDGTPCPNQADEGQEYCHFHLADSATMPNIIIKSLLGLASATLVKYRKPILDLLKKSFRRFFI